MELYVLSTLVVVGGGALVGFALRWWALPAPLILAGALAYGWEFYGPAVAYAGIAALLATIGVTLGIFLRRRLSLRKL